jgi:hypothetical protein
LTVLLAVGVIAASVVISAGAAGTRRHGAEHRHPANAYVAKWLRVKASHGRSVMQRLVTRSLQASSNSVTCSGSQTPKPAGVDQYCLVLQPNGTCIEQSTSPTVVQECDFTQTASTGNKATAVQVILAQKTASPQNGTQIVRLSQTAGTGSNLATIGQGIKQSLGPGLATDADDSELEPDTKTTATPIVQQQDSHQIVHVRQVTASGSNGAAIGQGLRQRERAGNDSTEIDQCQNVHFDEPPCTADVNHQCVVDPGEFTTPPNVDPTANMCTLVNQSAGTGGNTLQTANDYGQFQRAHKTPTGEQVQGSPFDGGSDQGIVQDGAAPSTISTSQNERQTQRTVQVGPSFFQTQNGPTRKGEGSTQGSNAADTWKGDQSSTQLQTNHPTTDMIGSASIVPGFQTNELDYSGATSGHIEATQKVTQNGQTIRNSCSSGPPDGVCDISIVCGASEFAPTLQPQPPSDCVPSCPPGEFYDTITQQCMPSELFLDRRR